MAGGNHMGSYKYFWLCCLFLTGLQYVCLSRGPQEVLAATERLEWDVSAYCAPHVDVNSSANITVTILPKTTVSGTEVSAYMNLPDAPTQNAISHTWEYPNKGWHALLFVGPTVKGTFYCQDQTVSNKSLHVSYLPDQNTKIFLSSEEALSKTELDTIGSSSKMSSHKIQPDSEQLETFSAGLNSPNPYWLTFAFAMHSPHLMKTTLQFQFE